jgi:sulfur-oxidizing protein SoxX
MDNARYDDLTAALILRNIRSVAMKRLRPAADKGPICIATIAPRAATFGPLDNMPQTLLGAGPCSRNAMRPGRKASAVMFAGCVVGAMLGASARAQTPAMPGQTLAFDRAKGNCLTCHDIKGGDAPGNVGPQLADMKKRFPDRNELAAVIFDETRRNPQTVMPPFGRNLILTQDEIESIVDFLYTR